MRLGGSKYLLAAICLLVLAPRCGKPGKDDGSAPVIGPGPGPSTPLPPSGVPGQGQQDATDADPLPPTELPQKMMARMAAYSAEVQSLVIDGDNSDWQRLPQAKHPQAVDLSGQHDITAFAAAPTADELYVMIATRDIPTRDEDQFWLDWDFSGSHHPDIRLALNTHGSGTVLVYQHQRDPIKTQISGIKMRIGNVVEARIPYVSLLKALPENLAKQLREPSERFWMRFFPFTVRQGQVVDHGPALASFRLAPRLPQSFDVLPPSQYPGVVASMPLADTWFVEQGPYTKSSHSGGWYYDLQKHAMDFSPLRPQATATSQGSRSYGAEVRAPVAGQIRELAGTHDDTQALERGVGPAAAGANYITIQSVAGPLVRLKFLRKDSVTGALGAQVSEGQSLAQLGAQGLLLPSFLHWDAWTPDGRASVPIILKNVWVQLNPPGGETPWRRFFLYWQMREGYFVTAGQVATPDP